MEEFKMPRTLYKFCLVTILFLCLSGMSLGGKADSSLVVSSSVSQSFSNSRQTSFLMDSCTSYMLGQKSESLDTGRLRQLDRRNLTKLFRHFFSILIFFLFFSAIFWLAYSFPRQPADIFSNFIILHFIHSLDGQKS